MEAYCSRVGVQPAHVRFLFDGARIAPEQTPGEVFVLFPLHRCVRVLLHARCFHVQLEMQDEDEIDAMVCRDFACPSR